MRQLTQACPTRIVDWFGHKALGGQALENVLQGAQRPQLELRGKGAAPICCRQKVLQHIWPPVHGEVQEAVARQ